jgi:large subunit ribosomal protein L2
MALKNFRPVTKSQRGLILIDKSQLWKGRPEKSLTEGLSSTGGRNNRGRITIWHRGGGHKRLYRIIDFKRSIRNIEARVERIEYDPNRTCFIALVKYDTGQLTYILAPQKLNIGDKIIAKDDADIKPGNAALLKNIPVGTLVHSVEMKPGKGGQLARAAGSFVQIVGKDQGNVLIKLRSGEVRIVPQDCYATIGVLGNADHQNKTVGKAGRSRWLGRRPVVRGVAMNPIDHPHGGGEGKTSGGRHPVTPWGKKTKGKKTRNNVRTDKNIVRRRNKK